jgi:hypothetical protein
MPQKFTLEWKAPDVDCYSTLSPSIRSDRGLQPDWRPQKTEARINQFMPVHQIVSLQGRNRTCIAVSDAINPIATIKERTQPGRSFRLTSGEWDYERGRLMIQIQEDAE